MPKEIIQRNYTFEYHTDTEKGDGYITGVGAVFGQPTDIGGMFKEIIHKDAFEVGYTYSINIKDIQVPIDALDEYKTTTNFSQHASIITGYTE